MALKVKIGDMEVELETVEQVATLARYLDKNAPDQLPLRQLPIQPAASPPTNPFKISRAKWDHDTAWGFMSSLPGTARAFMAHLLTVRRVSSGEMAKVLKIEPNLLGPAIRSIKAKSHALGRTIPFEVRTESAPAGKTYLATHEFLAAAAESPTTLAG